MLNKDNGMGTELAITTFDRDIGVIINSIMDMSALCSVVVQKKQ